MGKASGLGSPPAKLMTSARCVSLSSSRISDAFIRRPFWLNLCSCMAGMAVSRLRLWRAGRVNIVLS